MTEFSLTHFVSGLIETQTPEVQLFSWEKSYKIFWSQNGINIPCFHRLAGKRFGCRKYNEYQDTWMISTCCEKSPPPPLLLNPAATPASPFKLLISEKQNFTNWILEELEFTSNSTPIWVISIFTKDRHWLIFKTCCRRKKANRRRKTRPSLQQSNALDITGMMIFSIEYGTKWAKKQICELGTFWKRVLRITRLLFRILPIYLNSSDNIHMIQTQIGKHISSQESLSSYLIFVTSTTSGACVIFWLV